jgi:phospho-N-acetylmuramoyl-pentapeptide-transferase
MLYYLLPPLSNVAPFLGFLNVARYITFRTAAASLSALLFSLIIGPWFIRKVRDFQIGQIIRQEGPQSHRAKAGTPTMGGILILGSAILPTLFWADLANPFVWIAVLATAGCGGGGRPPPNQYQERRATRWRRSSAWPSPSAPPWCGWRGRARGRRSTARS